MQPAFPFTTRDFLPRRLKSFAAVADRFIGLRDLQHIYGPVAARADFIAAALDALAIGVDIADDDLARVPADGPLVIVANHPHGAADGLALALALRRVRPDVKLVGNDLLTRVPEMREHLLAVDAFRTGAGRNRTAVRAAIDWVGSGHALVVFPAGAVAHVRATGRHVVDPPWLPGGARIAAAAGAPVLPVFIEGRNSALFVAAGRVHPVLRTLLLARELLRLRGTRISLRIGRAVSSRRLASLGEHSTQTAYLRVRCYGLAPAAPAGSSLRLARRAAAPAPVAPAMPADELAAEIARLPARATLVESGPWAVLHAAASDIPIVLQEIGRLRELAFRAANEGTGRARDLDRYDACYEHLFVWHRERRAIAGAYRVGRTDRLAPRDLYTRTLFRYRRRLLQELGPALELGRSFVAPGFQRDHQPLLLLWRGIGRLVAAEPRYRRLFGPVSISADYGRVTQQILARFLLANRSSATLAALVRPRRALATSPHDAPDALVCSTVAARLDEVDEIVRDLEAGRRGMPVLLRQYLKLNAKLLGFSVDPAFGHVLDGLVVVDLLDVDRALLVRYLGRDGAERLVAWHARPSLTPVTAASVPVAV